jgi:hypothetical protein
MIAHLRRHHPLLLFALLCASALFPASASAKRPHPFVGMSWWSVSSSAAPTNLPPAGEGQIEATAADLGTEEAKASKEHPIVLTDTVPIGLEVVAGGVKGYSRNPDGRGEVSVGGRGPEAELTCTEPTAQVVSCSLDHSLQPYEGLEMVIPVKVGSPSGTKLSNEVTVSGSEPGVPSASHTDTLTVQSGGTQFGAEKYELTPENENGTIDTQAGSHPFQLTTTLNFNEILERQQHPPEREEEAAPQLARNLHFDLPPGLLGNVTVVPQCSVADFDTINSGDSNRCPADTAIGAARVTLNEPDIYNGVVTETVPVFNLTPEKGEPARFGLEVVKVPVVFNTAVLTGSNYGVEVSVDNATEFATILKTQVTFWGTPSAEAHDHSRGWECVAGGHWVAGFNKPCVEAEEEPTPKPFLTLPTSCASAPSSTVTGDSWAGSTLAAEYVFPSSLTGCTLLGFTPAMSVATDTHAASSPTGLAVNIKVPQGSTLSAKGLAEADVKDTTLVLPEGVQASPGAADGLLKCSTGQVGFDPFSEGLEEALQLQNDHFSGEKTSCPEASKIGTVEIKTPLLENPLTGGVYLASQDTEPFKSPLVLYLLAEDPVTGVRVKLAGEVQINQSTGQLTSVFRNAPPLPFEELTLKLFGGPRASQSTPPECGNYATQATFSPSNGGATASASSGFSITEGAEGGCPSNPQPFAPALSSGPTTAQAGVFTDFSLTINHPDSDQALNGLTVHLPPGAAAELANVTPCAEPASPSQEWSCGPESLLGTATTSSGLGSDPYSLTGQVYLTAGYDGAPFGLLVATRAKAGPFDLGMVYVRSRINVDPNTAAVTITTDAGPHGDGFPTMLKGVPVQLKAINVLINREHFEFNPTNCSAPTVSATISGAQGATSTASSSYALENCANLPFAPKLTATAGGQASKANGASLNVKVEAAGLGQANIAKVDLTLPVALPSRLSTIQKACVLAVFEANPAACDEGSVIGKATIRTPVLKSPLTGPAYLVSHGGAAFPDVEFVLQGEGILLILDGKTDIKKGITYSRFESTPDAPFTSFITELPTGPHSALTAYVPESKHYSLCGANLVMPTVITAQNGAVKEQTTPILATGCKGVAAYKITRAQKLAKALKACRKLKKKSKRVLCEAKARKHYGPLKKATKKKASKKK